MHVLGLVLAAIAALMAYSFLGLAVAESRGKVIAAASLATGSVCAFALLAAAFL